MIAQELEVSLHMAFVEARQKRHEFITVEHLLLALLDNPTAAEVLRACAANIDELRKALADFITAHTPTVAGTEIFPDGSTKCGVLKMSENKPVNVVVSRSVMRNCLARLR